MLKTIKTRSWKSFFLNETKIINKRKFSRNTMLLRKSSNIIILKFILTIISRSMKIYDNTFLNLRSLIVLLTIWKKKLNETLFKFVNFNQNYYYIKLFSIRFLSKNKILNFDFIILNIINLITIEHLSLRLKINKN